MLSVWSGNAMPQKTHCSVGAALLGDCQAVESEGCSGLVDVMVPLVVVVAAAMGWMLNELSGRGEESEVGRPRAGMLLLRLPIFLFKSSRSKDLRAALNSAEPRPVDRFTGPLLLGPSSPPGSCFMGMSDIDGVPPLDLTSVHCCWCDCWTECWNLSRQSWENQGIPRSESAERRVHQSLIEKLPAQLVRPGSSTQLTLAGENDAGASAIEISTCGVRKCMGGVALSADLAPIESPLSLYVAAMLKLQLTSRGEQFPPGIIEETLGPLGPGLSKSMPCLSTEIFHTFHRASSVATQWARFYHVMLSNMLVLEVCPHSNLSLEASIAYWAVERQRFGVCSEMFSQMIFSEETFLAYSALVHQRLEGCLVRLIGLLHYLDHHPHRYCCRHHFEFPNPLRFLVFHQSSFCLAQPCSAASPRPQPSRRRNSKRWETCSKL
uniref:Uncharacterized protein n=1 Tax=Timema shepardi TaxID=629360 RepID=A0A7R9G216_TIMSH|nr:unnamed protein product [Timema shepardi]